MSNKIPVIIITGASRGIGRGIAIQLASMGYSIAINYNQNINAAEETIKLCELKRLNDSQVFSAFKADVGNSNDRLELINEVLDKLGRIDGLVNNAGVGPKNREDITETSEISFDDVVNINLKGPFFLTQLLTDYWLHDNPKPALSSGFKVIFISSISAETVSLNRPEYCIAKAGLSMVSKLWASRLAAEGILVYEVIPGIMLTDMTKAVKEKYDKLMDDETVPQKRWGEPKDVALAVGALIRGDFPYSTGAPIYVDGGFHLKKL